MIALYENAFNIVCTGEYDELRAISHDLRFRPNGYYYANSFIRFKETMGKEGWDGFNYPLKIAGGNSAKILRGYKQTIISLANANGIQVNTDKCLDSPFKDISVEDVHSDLIAGDFGLDDDQRMSICQWLRNGMGVAHVTVGGGKTATFAGAAHMIGKTYEKARFLYVTPSERLVRQSTKDMKIFLPGWKIGQFGGGKHEKDDCDMVVCTVAILSRHLAKLIKEGWFKQFYAVLYDEVHHCASDSSQAMLESVPAFFRLGASDTMSEKDPSRQHFVRGLFGPVINRVRAAPLIQSGRLAKPHIYLVEMPEWRNKFKDLSKDPGLGTSAFVLMDGAWVKGIYRGPLQALDKKGKPAFAMKRSLDEKNEWIKTLEPVLVPGIHLIEMDGQVMEIESRWCLLNRMYDRGIIRFKERNELLTEWAVHYSQRGLKTLVVCTRTLHIFILEALMKAALGDEMVQILFSRDTSKQRDTAFEWLRSTPGAVLVSSVVKEGVSINEIGAGVIADYIGSWEVANQIVGRFIRPKREGENQAEITWIVDNQHPSYRRGCAQIFYQLEKIQGYRFYYPCTTPDSVERSLQFEGAKSVLPALGARK